MTRIKGIIDRNCNPFSTEGMISQGRPLTPGRKEQLGKLFGKSERQIRDMKWNDGCYPAFVGIRWGFARYDRNKDMLERTQKWHERHLYDGFGERITTL